MTNSIALNFAAALPPLLPPLPSGPSLSLPAGEVGVMDRGRIYFHNRWVIAVGLSPGWFLMVRPGSPRWVPPVLREQLAGYLTACGAHVLPVQMRYGLDWHQGGGLARTSLFWLDRYVDSLSVGFRGSSGLRPVRTWIAVGSWAQRAQKDWQQVEEIWEAMLSQHPQLRPQLIRMLWELARGWEVYWAMVLRAAGACGMILPADRAAVHGCDRAWINVVRLYLEPLGYDFLPATIVRLL